MLIMGLVCFFGRSCKQALKLRAARAINKTASFTATFRAPCDASGAFIQRIGRADLTATFFNADLWVLRGGFVAVVRVAGGAVVKNVRQGSSSSFAAVRLVARMAMGA